MLDVITETVINRPRAEVAAYAADPANITAWYANIQTVEWLAPPPLRAGTRLAFTASFLGRRLVYSYDVIEYAPGERLVMRTAEGPFPMETSYTWTSIDEHITRMVLRNRGTPSGFSRLLAPLMALAVRSANRKDLRRLKTQLEAQDTSPSGTRSRTA